MLRLKQIFKRNSHSRLLKPLAGFGRSINRLYENRNHDIYSNGELTLLKKLSTIRPDVIIDGGANIGNYSILASKTLPICKVYAFEPVKTTFQHLVENTKNNYCIRQINKGLYNQNCSKEIFLYPKDEWASLFNIEEAYKSNEVESIDLIRGDDFVAENDIKEIDLLKVLNMMLS